MKHVIDYIARWEHRLSQHEMFTRMKVGNRQEDVLSFAPLTAFVILLFQDIIKINVKLTRDPYLRMILARHAEEDRAHDLWFLDDLKVIFGADRKWEIGWLFSQENAVMREACLALTSEVYRIQDDRLRLVYIEALEATSQVFFPMVSHHLKELGLHKGLKFFTGVHIDVEEDHTLFKSETKQQRRSIVLPAHLRAEALGIVDRVFESFVMQADGLLEHLGEVAFRRDWLPQPEEVAARTLTAFGSARLSPLCRALGLETAATLQHFDKLTTPWGARPVRKVAQWPSELGEDHSPFELALTFQEGQGELRALVEPLGEVPTLAANWSAAQELCGRLGFEYQLPLERLRLIEELFEPGDAGARFAMRHEMRWRRGAPPELELHLDPRARGRERAPALVEEALSRLGLGHAWRSIRELLRREEDRLCAFSLQLTASPEARVGVSVAHEGATIEDVAQGLASGWKGPSLDARKLYQSLAGGEQPFVRRPLVSSVLLATGGGAASERGRALLFPVRAHVNDDGVALRRIAELLEPQARQLYLQAIPAVAGRPLEAGVGMHHAVSLQWHGTGRCLGIHLAPEAYAVMVPRDTPGRPSLARIHGD